VARIVVVQFWTNWEVRMLQALIGTVETLNSIYDSQDDYEFQALIGTVETPRPRHLASIGRAFQALIGTVETTPIGSHL